MLHGRKLKEKYAIILMSIWLGLIIISAFYMFLFSLGMFILYLTVLYKHCNGYSFFASICHTLEYFMQSISHDSLIKVGVIVMVFAMTIGFSGTNLFQNEIYAADQTVVTVTAKKELTKDYDETGDYTLKDDDYTLNGVTPGDDVKLSAKGEYNDWDGNVAYSTKVILSDLKLIGKDAGKYKLDVSELTFPASIKPIPNQILWNEETEYEYNGKDQFIEPMYYLTLRGIKHDSSEIGHQVFQNDKKANFKEVGEYEFRVLLDSEDCIADMKNYDFKGSQLSKSFKILGKTLDLSMVQGIEKRYEQTGKSIFPKYKLVDNDAELKYGTDYTVKDSGLPKNTTTAGQKSFMITGIGAYSGSTLTVPFEVYYADYPDKLLPEDGKNENGFYSQDFLLDVGENRIGTIPDFNSGQTTFTISEEGYQKELTLYIIRRSDRKIYVANLKYNLDKTKPTLSGIEDGKTYYVDQKLNGMDENFDAFIINSKKVSGKTAIIEALNIQGEVTIKGIDKAGNETDEYTITMGSLADVLDSSLTEDNVDFDDIDQISESLKVIEGIDIEDATQEQKKNLEEMKKHADDLLKTLDQIKQVENLIKGIEVKDEYTQVDKEKLNEIYDKFEELSEHQKDLMNTDLKETIEGVIKSIRTDHLVNIDSGIIVTGKDGTDFDNDAILSVENVTEKIDQSFKDKINLSLIKDLEIKKIWDIKLLLNGNPIQPEGTVLIKIPLSKEEQSYQNLHLYHVMDNGDLTEIQYERIGHFIQFERSHFSYYAIVGNKEKQEITPPTGGNENTGETENQPSEVRPSTPQEKDPIIETGDNTIVETEDYTCIYPFVILLLGGLYITLFLKKKEF